MCGIFYLLCLGRYCWQRGEFSTYNVWEKLYEVGKECECEYATNYAA